VRARPDDKRRRDRGDRFAQLIGQIVLRQRQIVRRGEPGRTLGDHGGESDLGARSGQLRAPTGVLVGRASR
jgi:hypothetical protein